MHSVATLSSLSPPPTPCSKSGVPCGEGKRCETAIGRGGQPQGDEEEWRFVDLAGDSLSASLPILLWCLTGLFFLAKWHSDMTEERKEGESFFF